MRTAWTQLIAGGVIVALTLAAYAPAMRAKFIWDDELYLTGNPEVTSPQLFGRIWSGAQSPTRQYYPLTITTFWLEWRLWGLSPAGYHLTNILLHALGCVLLWRVFRRLAVPGAWLGALLFALHPVNVASVAWVSERKNTLSLVFSLLAVLMYLNFQARRRWPWYFLALAAFALALLSKTAVLTLPIALLLLAWWSRRRLAIRDLVYTLPFFLLSAGMALVTISLERPGPGLIANWAGRLLVAGRAPWFYLYKAAWPVDLMMVYPRWRIDPAAAASYLPLVALVGMAGLLWRARSTRLGRPVAFALGLYLAGLIPVLGLATFSFMEYSFVSDHLQYLPLAAICGLAGSVAASAWRRLGPRPLAFRQAQGGQAASRLLHLAGMVTVAAAVVAIGVLTWMRSAAFHDHLSLWTDNIARNQSCYVAYNNRAGAWLEKDEYDRAVEDCNRAIELNPLYVEAYNHRGNARRHRGEFERAKGDFAKALSIKPDYAPTYHNLGNVWVDQKNDDEAIANYSKAISLDPSLWGTRFSRAEALVRKGRYREAAEDYTLIIAARGDLWAAYHNRAICYCNIGLFDLAWADVQMCRKLNREPDRALVDNLIRARERQH